MNKHGGDTPRADIRCGAEREPVHTDASDPVTEAYKRDVDRTLLRENLRLSVEERLRKLEDAAGVMVELRAAGAAHRALSKPRHA